MITIMYGFLKLSLKVGDPYFSFNTFVYQLITVYDKRKKSVV